MHPEAYLSVGQEAAEREVLKNFVRFLPGQFGTAACPTNRRGLGVGIVFIRVLFGRSATRRTCLQNR